jgi:hypothetical protein
MTGKFVLTGSLGSVEVQPGRKFVDNGVTWEVVDFATGWNYSPSGAGGAPSVKCKVLSGLPDGRFAPYMKDGMVDWCGDSLASAIIQYEALIKAEDQRLLKVIASIPQQGQRQYGTDEQLQYLIQAANRLGLYDAADSVRNFLKRP